MENVVLTQGGYCQQQYIAEQKKQNRNYFLTKALPAGAIIFGADVFLRGSNEKNKADTFIKTVKNYAKEYTISNKKDFSSFFGEFLKMDKFGKWINKVGNKPMFAFLMGAEILINAICVKSIHDWFKNK